MYCYVKKKKNIFFIIIKMKNKNTYSRFKSYGGEYLQENFVSTKFCKSNSDCTNNEFCFQEALGMNKYCKAKLDDYEPCLYNEDCKINSCVNKQCRKKKHGEKCLQNSECMSNNCYVIPRASLKNAKMCM